VIPVGRRRVGLVIAASLAAAAVIALAGLDLRPVREHSQRRRPARSGQVAGRHPVSSQAGGSRVGRRRGVYAGIAPGDWSPAVRGVRERVYVPNSEDGTVSVIDPHTFKVTRTFPAGAYDQHVTPAWGLHRLYVDDTTANALTVVDPRTGSPVRTIPVPDPYNLYFHARRAEGHRGR